MINMTRNKIPKAMHKYNNQDGPTRQSVQIDSASENEKKNKITVLWGCAADTQPKNKNKIELGN